MKPEQQNKTIAKHCGWKQSTSDNWGGWWHKKGSRNYQRLHPNYRKDLNAMFNAESTLQHYGYYVDELASVMGVQRQSISVVGATAAQRAEAFLRTLNLWQES